MTEPAQDSLHDQMIRVLELATNRGEYDAADWISRAYNTETHAKRRLNEAIEAALVAYKEEGSRYREGYADGLDRALLLVERVGTAPPVWPMRGPDDRSTP